MNVNARPPTTRVDWTAALWAGLIAGLVFLAVWLGLVALGGGSIWGPVNATASILLGVDAVGWPPRFSPSLLIVGLLVHFAVSIVATLVLAWIVHRWTLLPALIAGALYGLVLYVSNILGWAEWFWVFNLFQDWATAIAMTVFGVVAAWAYKVLERTEPVPVRAT
jgi:hypothetical protein